MSDVVDVLIARLVDELVPRIADELERRGLAISAGESASNGGPLLSLDEVIALLPKSKPADTWRRWLYARLGSRPQVPGAVKLGGAWAFREADVRAWLENGDVQDVRGGKEEFR